MPSSVGLRFLEGRRESSSSEDYSEYSSDLASNNAKTDDEDGWTTFLSFLGGGDGDAHNTKAEARFCRA